MKPKYKNWIANKYIFFSIILTLIIASLLTLSFSYCFSTMTKGALIFLLIITALTSIKLIHVKSIYKIDGKINLMKKIINYIASYSNLVEGGKALDVGCGSGLLSITLAKQHPHSQIYGIDYWKKGASGFSYDKKLCINNAIAENVHNTIFQQGNAIKLNFDDETFDLVTSNFVYHNISTVKNKQELLDETFRVLKKGGYFALHDLYGNKAYKDMNQYVKELKNRGFDDVKFIHTGDDCIVDKKIMHLAFLKNSGLLVGRK